MNKPRAKGFRKNQPDLSDSRMNETKEINAIFGVLPVLEALRAEKRRVEKLYILEGAQ